MPKAKKPAKKKKYAKYKYMPIRGVMTALSAPFQYVLENNEGAVAIFAKNGLEQLFELRFDPEALAFDWKNIDRNDPKGYVAPMQHYDRDVFMTIEEGDTLIVHGDDRATDGYTYSVIQVDDLVLIDDGNAVQVLSDDDGGGTVMVPYQSAEAEAASNERQRLDNLHKSATA